MKILIGCINLDTKPVTDLFLETLKLSIDTYFRGISSNFPDTHIDTVVVVHGREDNAIELKDKYPFVKRWIENDTPKTCAFGWNQIIKYGFDSSAAPLYDYYLVLNNDLYFTVKSISNFIECLKQNKNPEEIGYISFMGNDFKEPELTGIIETVVAENRYWSGIRPDANDVDSPEMLKGVIKTNYAPFGGIEAFASSLESKYGIILREMHQKAFGFALSKECIKKVGLFDEYGEEAGIHEDADYGLRMTAAGVKTALAQGAYVHHFSMLSRTKNKYKGDWWVESREKAFREKWGVPSKGISVEMVKNAKFRLDIGSGTRPQKQEGKHWYHLEIDPDFNDVEFLNDASKGLPFPEESLIEIYCSNNLEHQEWKQIENILRNWCSKLVKGGIIEIRVPNFRFLAEQYLAGSWKMSLKECDYNAMHAVYGGEKPGCPHLHKVGFDFNNLSSVLYEVGFSDVKNGSQMGSWELRVLAVK